MTVEMAEQWNSEWSMMVKMTEQWNSETLVHDSEDDRRVELRNMGP